MKVIRFGGQTAPRAGYTNSQDTLTWFKMMITQKFHYEKMKLFHLVLQIKREYNNNFISIKLFLSQSKKDIALHGSSMP